MTTLAVPGLAFNNNSSAHADDEDSGEMEHDLGIGTSASANQGRHKLGAPLAYNYLDLLNPCMSWITVKDESDAIPYEPINVPSPTVNAPNKANTPLRNASAAPSLTSSKSVNGEHANSSTAPVFPLISSEVGWPKPFPAGRGLDNLGNTCFLNSALQALLHTPPLVRYIETVETSHRPPYSQNCSLMTQKGFCMACVMHSLVRSSFLVERRNSYAPEFVARNINKIAKHFRRGRQEDSHEFLRFVVDGLQTSALAGKPPKLEQRLKESTFVHQIFGGRLRSRVQCLDCDHPSDTFESMLDLSLDIGGKRSIKDALRQYVRVDLLKGANRCKRLVNAEKSFSIEKAPLVLTIHLKRFRADGRKNGDLIQYPETLEMGPYMSEAEANPSYRLYSVIYHSGGGPHSGHYTADVKTANGKWYHMDDSSVTARHGVPVNAKSAYVLFYCRDRGDQLRAAIYNPQSHPQQSQLSDRPAETSRHSGEDRATVRDASGVHNSNGKRPRSLDSESPSSAKKPFIGPQRPERPSPTPAAAQVNSPSAGSSPSPVAKVAEIPAATFYSKPKLSRPFKAPLRISTTGQLKKSRIGAMKVKVQSSNAPAVLTS